MQNRITIAAVLAFSVLSSSVTAYAAQITSLSGKVLLDRGNGFVALSEVVEVKPGHKIFVGKEAFAAVTYKNGCQVNFPAGTIAVIAPNAPCAKNAKIFTHVSSIIPAQAAPDDTIYTDPIVTDPIVDAQPIAPDTGVSGGVGGFVAENGMIIGIAAAGVAVAGGAVLILSGVFDKDKDTDTCVTC